MRLTILGKILTVKRVCNGVLSSVKSDGFREIVGPLASCGFLLAVIVLAIRCARVVMGDFSIVGDFLYHMGVIVFFAIAMVALGQSDPIPMSKHKGK